MSMLNLTTQKYQSMHLKDSHFWLSFYQSQWVESEASLINQSEHFKYYVCVYVLFCVHMFQIIAHIVIVKLFNHMHLWLNGFGHQENTINDKAGTSHELVIV